MSAAENGGPAFPMLELDRISGQVVHQHFGVTLRDYFAGQALAGGVAFHQEDGCIRGAHETADEAYRIADAMLAERAK